MQGEMSTGFARLHDLQKYHAAHTNAIVFINSYPRSIISKILPEERGDDLKRVVSALYWKIITETIFHSWFWTFWPSPQPDSCRKTEQILKPNQSLRRSHKKNNQPQFQICAKNDRDHFIRLESLANQCMRNLKVKSKIVRPTHLSHCHKYSTN